MVAGLLMAAVLAQTQEVTLVFGGDVIPHDPVKYAARVHGRFAREGDAGVPQNNHGWDHVFGPLSRIFREADEAVVNLETPVGYFAKPETGEMVFHAEPDLLNGLKASGVTVATFANNHCLDQHREGIVSTREELRRAGLASAGSDVTEAASWQPLILERHGLRIGILPFTRFLNGFHNAKTPDAPHVPLVHYDDDHDSGGHSEAELLAYVSEAARRVDALIVVPHWGDEYKPLPKLADRALAQSLLKAGALAIIGMHPHVLQPTEKHIAPDGRAALVAFSLGNLVSNQDLADAESPKREGLLLQVRLARREGRVRIVSVVPIPLHTENRLAAGKRRNIQPLVLADEIAALRERLVEIDARGLPQTSSERRQVNTRLEQMLAREQRIMRTLEPDVTGAPW